MIHTAFKASPSVRLAFKLALALKTYGYAKLYGASTRKAISLALHSLKRKYPV